MAFFVVPIQETWKDWRQANTWNIRTQMGGGDLMTNKFMTWSDELRYFKTGTLFLRNFGCFSFGLISSFVLGLSCSSLLLLSHPDSNCFFCKKTFSCFIWENQKINICINLIFSEMKRLTIEAKILIDTLSDRRPFDVNFNLKNLQYQS